MDGWIGERTTRPFFWLLLKLLSLASDEGGSAPPWYVPMREPRGSLAGKLSSDFEKGKFPVSSNDLIDGWPQKSRWPFWDYSCRRSKADFAPKERAKEREHRRNASRRWKDAWFRLKGRLSTSRLHQQSSLNYSPNFWKTLQSTNIFTESVIFKQFLRV